MALRKVTLWSGALALFVSQAAMSVGLGEIKLNSALNEPLDAEIELLNIGDLSELEMLVGLASRSDFERAGVSREFFHSGMQFTVELSGTKPRILVKTQKPVREPFLDFLVEMQWPSGRLLRDYTLLIDLPVFSEQKPEPKPVENASSGARSGNSDAKPSPRPDRRPPAPSLEAGSEYTVRNGETLWGIARKARPQGASTHQTMVTIHRLNPGAFVNGDINMLKRGEVLRLPENHQITTSHREALTEVALQQQQSGALIDAIDSDQQQPMAAEDTPPGRLRLSAATSEQAEMDSAAQSVVEGDTEGDGVAAREALENELIIAQEELARKDRELAERDARLAKLEEQLGLREQIIDLQSSDAKAVQLAAEKLAEATEEATGEPIEGALEESTETGDQPAVADLTEESAAETAAEPEVVIASQPQQASFWEQYKYYLMGGGGLLLLVLLMLGLRRKKDGSDEVDAFDFDEDVEPVFAQPEIAAMATPVVEPEEQEEVDLSDDDQLFEAESFDMEDEDNEQPQPESDAESDREDIEEEAEQLDIDTTEDAVETQPQDNVAEEADNLDFDLDLQLDDEELEAVTEEVDDADELNLDEAEVGNDEESLAEGEFDLDIDGDEIATKLDLAKAYSDVGDKDGAREMLQEVVDEGSEEQQQEAKKLLESLN